MDPSISSMSLFWSVDTWPSSSDSMWYDLPSRIRSRFDSRASMLTLLVRHPRTSKRVKKWQKSQEMERSWKVTNPSDLKPHLNIGGNDITFRSGYSCCFWLHWLLLMTTVWKIGKEGRKEWWVGEKMTDKHNNKRFKKGRELESQYIPFSLFKPSLTPWFMTLCILFASKSLLRNPGSNNYLFDPVLGRNNEEEGEKEGEENKDVKERRLMNRKQEGKRKTSWVRKCEMFQLFLLQMEVIASFKFLDVSKVSNVRKPSLIFLPSFIFFFSLSLYIYTYIFPSFVSIFYQKKE